MGYATGGLKLPRLPVLKELERHAQRTRRRRQ